MTWLLPPGLTDGQAYWICFAVALFMVGTGWLMARSLYRTHRALARSRRAHPANRPYDWSRDRYYRQASCVHRRAS